MDSCMFKHFVLQSAHCALQIDWNVVFLVRHHNTDVAESSLNKCGLMYLFVNCRSTAVENNIVGFCEVKFREPAVHEVDVVEKWLSSTIIQNGFDVIIKS